MLADFDEEQNWMLACWLANFELAWSLAYCLHSNLIHVQSPGGGGGPYMKQTGMLVVSLRGVNVGFWSRLGCSGQSAKVLSRQGLV